MKLKLRPIFIGGAGRCGATVLTSMVATSLQVARFEREVRFFIDHGGLLDLADCMTVNWDTARGSAAIKQWATLLQGLVHGHRPVVRKSFYNWKALFQASKALLQKLTWGRAPRGLYETSPLDETVMRAHLQQFIDGAYKPLRKGATVCLDDTSHSILAVHRLKRWFPEAQVVWVVRDPYDVAICYNEARWSAATFEANAKRVCSVMDKALMLRNDLHVVYFEELVRDPKSVLAAVCSHLGVSGAKVNQDLRGVKTGRWKDLPSKTARMLRRELADVRERLGYVRDKAIPRGSGLDLRG